MKTKRVLTFSLLCIWGFLAYALEENQDLLSEPIIPVGNIPICDASGSLVPTPTFKTYFSKLFTTEHWPARWTCGDWSTLEGWMYISSDLSIFIAYFSIPIMLLWFIRKERLGRAKRLVVLFATFILLCGFTHLIDVILFWEPMYRLSGFAKLLTGIVSLSTATVLGFVIPKVLRYKSPEILQVEIDERKKIQNLFELFVQHSPGAVAMLDKDLNFVIVNNGWLTDYGVSESDVKEKSYFEVFPKDSLDLGWVSSIRKALKGETLKSDFDTFEGNKGLEYLRWELRPWYEANERIGGIIIFTELITEEVVIQKKLEEKEEEIRLAKKGKKQADQKVKEMDRLFSEMSVLANIGTWELDLSNQAVYWSDTVYHIHDEDPDKEISLESAINYYHQDYIQEIEQAVNAAIEKGESWDLELKIITAKGKEKWVRAIGQPVKQKEQVVKLQGLFQDIDLKKRYELGINQSRKNLEDMVNQRTEELKKANQDLEAFSYSVSHDLRAPLRAINGYSEALKEDYMSELDEDAVRYISRIAANSRKMGELIDDLLEFSRMDKKKLSISTIDLNASINQIINELFPDAREHVEVKELPSVEGDSQMIAQVFINLLSNAIKYSSKELKPKIIVSAIDNKKSTIVAITDNGVGFNMEYYDKLFSVFQRLHSESEFEGTGVGLSLCRKIMKAHNGKIWAESREGEGSTFYVSFNKT